MASRLSGRRCKPEVALMLALICLALTARLLPGQRIVDDAYITFRYARNLVRGTGFVYNPGERVLGTTTPLYTLVLAALAAGSGRISPRSPPRPACPDYAACPPVAGSKGLARILHNLPATDAGCSAIQGLGTTRSAPRRLAARCAGAGSGSFASRHRAGDDV